MRTRPLPLGYLPPETPKEPPAVLTTDLQNREVRPLAVGCVWYFVIVIIGHEYTAPAAIQHVLSTADLTCACPWHTWALTVPASHSGAGNGNDCLTRFRAP